MHRASISIDLILSIVIMLAAATAIFSLAWVQMEQAQATNYKYKAESMAMSIGTALNHFYATNPESGSTLTITVKDEWDTLSGLSISAETCQITFTKNSVSVGLQLRGEYSFLEEEVSATYPLATNFQLPDGDCSIPIEVVVK